MAAAEQLPSRSPRTAAAHRSALLHLLKILRHPPAFCLTTGGSFPSSPWLGMRRERGKTEFRAIGDVV